MSRQKTAPAREKRIRTIGAFIGPIERLIDELRDHELPQRIRTYSEAASDDLVQALRLLSGIEGAGIIVHGPRGCAASVIESDRPASVVVTHLDERDTIMGSDRAVSQAARKLVARARPWVILLVGTPVVAINNDDIRSTASELSEELGLPVLPIFCDGFRSRFAETGFDVAFHGLLKLIPRRDGPAEKGLVNLLSITEGDAAAVRISKLLDGFGIRVNRLPAGAGSAQFEGAGRAVASVGIDPDATRYLGRDLASSHGIPFLDVPPPIGVVGTKAWLEAVARAAGVEEKVPLVHGVELSNLPAGFGRALSGMDVWIGFPPSVALAAAGLVGEMGGRVSGLSVDYADAGHAARLDALAANHPALPVHAGVGQTFEAVNLLRRNPPALYIGTPDRAAVATRAGIPAVGILPDELLGYRGVCALVRRAAKALKNRGFADSLSGVASSRYRDGWLRRSPDWHIKMEVK
ncbi:MAG TPA: nitrogenase component 1 [Candidatus Deferrimicrobiaceae bacterium]|jgi:nitrogenase molybdenum-iron protein alpha/beta subunit